MIRLQNHGKKNHPYWWVIVQPKNKCFKGRAIERIGIWAPRKTKTVDRSISINKYKLKYWLSVGATPTEGAQRILSMAGLFIKKPVPYGSKYLYEKKTKTYPLEYFHKHRWGLTTQEAGDIYHYEKLKRMEEILKRKIDSETEALSEIIRPRDLTSKYNENVNLTYKTDMNTDDINSDDFDFYSRKRNFDIISNKLKIYLDTKFEMYRGNDLRYNNYLRKLEKLSKQESLDYEGFKDYLKGVKELNESKSGALQNIANHFLNELLDKESLQNDIREIVKSVNLDLKENESSTNPGEKKNNHDIKIENLKRTAEKDLNTVIDVMTKGFESVARQTFKVGSEEHFTDKAFQDLKNLRMIKLVTKLRCGIIQSDQMLNKFLKTVENNYSGSNPKGIYSSLNNADFFNSIQDNLKSSPNDQDSPFFDKEILKLILSKHENITNYDDMLFDKINNYLLSTETLKKFQTVLFDPEFYGHENLTSEEKSKILQNPNVYLLNNDIIDELIASLLQKINNKYEMNEVYNDDETDLNKFEVEERVLVKRRTEMEKRMEELKSKHGSFDLMYDDYQSESQELREDLSNFKKDYQQELEAELDQKFKRTLKIITPPMKLRKYYTPEELEEAKAKEDKLDRIRNRVLEEVKLKRIGIEKDPKEKKEEEELSPEEREYEAYFRYEFETKLLGSKDQLMKSVIPLPDDERPTISLTKYLEMAKRKYKKQGKLPRQEEILKLNKEKLRMNEIYLHSMQASRGITKDRQEEMKKRFLHYFGNYKSMMYPDGFRHYENLENYQAVYPDRTMMNYQSECNILNLNYLSTSNV